MFWERYKREDLKEIKCTCAILLLFVRNGSKKLWTRCIKLKKYKILIK